MKSQLFILGMLLSISGIAQPSITGAFTSPAADTVVFFPTNTITLSGNVNEANPGHPVLDTSWEKTSGPAATITLPSNRMTTTVTGLALGDYVFTLTATDKKNSASKTLSVKVISGLLPVGFSYFHVAKNANGVLVSWCTQMESNNSRFVIQKSVDGAVFSDVASVDSKAKNGNSNTMLDYSYQISGKMADADAGSGFLVITLLSFILMISKSRRIYKSLFLIIFCLSLFSCSKSMMTPDNSVTVPTKTFYRLKLVNLDGQFTYSGIIINR